MLVLRRNRFLEKKFLAFSYLQPCFSTSQEAPQFNYFEFGSRMIPHPEKVKKGGEDAFFANKNVLSVADGVGGWADVGVDPGLYSKRLCKNIEELVKNRWDIYKISTRQLLIDAAERTKEQGSSTVCITILDEQRPLLHTAYIGDSSYLLLRLVEGNLKVLHHSPEQQKEFNFPFQIGSYGDPPQAAKVTNHQVQHNDIVVVGTDGLFDNLEDKQIVDTIKPFVQANPTIADLGLVSDMIAELAYKFSLDMKYMSPFAKKAYEAYYDYQGGKSDDITVVVGQVKIQGSQLQMSDFE